METSGLSLLVNIMISFALLVSTIIIIIFMVSLIDSCIIRELFSYPCNDSASIAWHVDVRPGSQVLPSLKAEDCLRSELV